MRWRLCAIKGAQRAAHKRQRVNCRVQLIVRFALKSNKYFSTKIFREQRPTASKLNIARELLEADSSQNSRLFSLDALFLEAYQQRNLYTILAG